jgi:predicted NBD/HSP70 family sugar kinase
LKHFISIDIGGTDIKYGIINDQGEIVQKSKTPTEALKGNKSLVQKLLNIVSELLKYDYVISGIGISTAGVVDTEKGEIIYAGGTMPGYKGTKLKEILEGQFGLSTKVNNDVNAAALGEAWVGAAKGVNTFFCMTLGTGIGGAIIIDKKLYKGFHYKAAEIGYMFKEKGAESFYETKAATSILIKTAQRELENEDIDGSYIFEQAKQGDIDCNRMINSWVEEVTRGIANIIFVLDPELIIIGGGVSKQGEFLIKRIKNKLPLYLPPNFDTNTMIKTAEYGNDAGMLGAVYEFL